MRLEEIRKIVDDRYAECIQHQFGLWIIGLFHSFPELAFKDQKAAFFTLLARLLDEEKVRFVKPVADVYYNAESNPNPKYTINDIEAHWTVSTAEIIQYLQAQWPEEADHSDDLALNAYFYEIPAIIWVDGEGCWHGS